MSASTTPTNRALPSLQILLANGIPVEEIQAALDSVKAAAKPSKPAEAGHDTHASTHDSHAKTATPKAAVHDADHKPAHDTHATAHDSHATDHKPAHHDHGTPHGKPHHDAHAEHDHGHGHDHGHAGHGHAHGHGHDHAHPVLSEGKQKALRVALSTLAGLCKEMTSKSIAQSVARDAFAHITGSNNFNIDPAAYEPKGHDADQFLKAFAEIEKAYPGTQKGQRASTAGSVLRAALGK